MIRILRSEMDTVLGFSKPISHIVKKNSLSLCLLQFLLCVWGGGGGGLDISH